MPYKGLKWVRYNGCLLTAFVEDVVLMSNTSGCWLGSCRYVRRDVITSWVLDLSSESIKIQVEHTNTLSDQNSVWVVVSAGVCSNSRV
jgi:hypothetical protein